jgi:hypothetical protein
MGGVTVALPTYLLIGCDSRFAPLHCEAQGPVWFARPFSPGWYTEMTMTSRLHLAVVVLIPLALAGCGSEASGPTAPSTPPPPAPDPITRVTVVFGGRVVDADTGGPVANVVVSVSGGGYPGPPRSAVRDEQVVYSGGGDANEIATSGADGTFTLPLNLWSDWTSVVFKFTGPAGYDATYGGVQPTCRSSSCWAAADRPAIRMYPTLVIKPDESIKVRVTGRISLCGWMMMETSCRRVLVAAAPGDLVALEMVPDDSRNPMALLPESAVEFDGSARRVMVEPGGFAYVWADYGVEGATATLTARR